MNIARSLTVALAILVAAAASGDDKANTRSSGPGKLTSDQREFLRLVKELDQRFDWEMRMMPLKAGFDVRRGKEIMQTDEPAIDEVQALLKFEAKHHQKLLGLMALRKLSRHMCRFGLAGPKLIEARNQVIMRLPAYVEFPELAETLKHVVNGWNNTNVGSALRTIIEHPDTSAQLRANAQLRFVTWVSSFDQVVMHRGIIEARLAELQGKDDDESVTELVLTEFMMGDLPDLETYNEWKDEVNEIVAELQTLGDDIRVIDVRNLDREHHIVVFDEERTAGKARISVRARNLSYTRPGHKLEDFEVTLINGSQWRLSDQRGKTVVLQFSFAGCGPCKQLDPALSKLHAEGSPAVSVLTLMTDEDAETTQRAATANSLNWPVCHDVPAGGIADRWGITAFPTILIVDGEGRVSSIPPPEIRAIEAVVDSLIASTNSNQ